MEEHAPVRIRLLGDFQVWRADGSLVAPEEWRTGKTRDLLRLLALENGHVVRPTGLIDALWPDAPEDRARNSLRTATSRIRQATGSPCVVRRLHGLVLLGASVDVIDFRDVARRAHLAFREGRHQRVLDLCETAEGLHGGEFHAYDDDSTWAQAQRAELRRLRHTMLLDAAESALAIGRPGEAADLASTAVRLDESSEATHRALMRAHAELGEVASALRIFETYRAQLADELGADPSPQTRELHLTLLRGLGA